MMLVLLAAASAADSTVYIIRHGEKTFGGGCLNIQGQERANNLFNIFNGERFAAPTAIFANNYYGGASSDPGSANCERCWLTVQPLAQHLHLSVAFNNGYPEALGGNQGGADAIKRAAQNHSTILVSWEHYNIQFLATDLGVPKSQIPDWSGEDYDSVYVLNLTSTGALSGFQVKAQSYTPQSTTCPPHFVPPGSSPTPPAPVPPGHSWECHANKTTTNAMGLHDSDLKYVGSARSDCENQCNVRGCPVIVWHATDEHCHVLSGSLSHDDFVASLTTDHDRSTCMLVPERDNFPPN